MKQVSNSDYDSVIRLLSWAANRIASEHASDDEQKRKIRKIIKKWKSRQ